MTETASQALRLIDETISRLGHGLILLDRDGLVAWHNSHAAAYEAEGRLSGRRLLDVLLPQAAPADQQAIFTELEAGRPVNLSQSVNGYVMRHLRLSAISPAAGGDEQFGLLVVAEDTTEQFIATESLRLTESRYQELLQRDAVRLSTALEQSADSIVVYDSRFSIEYVNKAFEDSSGFPRDFVLGLSMQDLLVENADEGLFERISARLNTGETWQGQLTSRRRDGTTFVEEAVLAPVRDAGGRVSGFICTKRDVTQERSLEEQLRQAQKMEAVGHMAGGIAHEFNNLLTAILGNLSMAEHESPPEGKLRNSIRDAAAAAERCADLTKQLLMFSRKTGSSLKPVDLSSIVQSACKLARPMLDPLALELDAPESVVAVLGDSTSLHQVLMNLLLNARDAMNGRGSIRTRLCVRSMNDEPIVPQVPTSAVSFACLEVRDSGSGMDRQTLKRIFEPFFTTKSAGRGTGLGLAVVYGIVKQHSGWIEVESEPGQGSTFKLFLPLTDKQVEAADAPRPQAPGGVETILVVEDEPVIVQLLGDMLNSSGYKVLMAQDGLTAIEMYRANADKIDLVVLDVVLPGPSGVEIWHTLRAEYPDLNVLFSSGHAPDEEMQALCADGGPPFISKPYRSGELLKCVREALDSRTVKQ